MTAAAPGHPRTAATAPTATGTPSMTRASDKRRPRRNFPRVYWLVRAPIETPRGTTTESWLYARRDAAERTAARLAAQGRDPSIWTCRAADWTEVGP